MIAFRHADRRFPFLRERSSQPAGRGNEGGDWTHYLCHTPDGAWAEFLRHEQIDDPQDLVTIRRAMWAVDFGQIPEVQANNPEELLCGSRKPGLHAKNSLSRTEGLLTEWLRLVPH